MRDDTMSRRLDWGVRAVIEHNGALLAVKNAVESRDFYCLPSGGVEEGESVIEALEREIYEELGVKPVIGNLLYVHQLSNFNNNGQRFGQPSLIFYVTNGVDFTDRTFATASHANELTAAEFIDPSTVDFKPKELVDDWPTLVEHQFSLPAKSIVGEWRP